MSGIFYNPKERCINEAFADLEERRLRVMQIEQLGAHAVAPRPRRRPLDTHQSTWSKHEASFLMVAGLILMKIVIIVMVLG